MENKKLSDKRYEIIIMITCFLSHIFFGLFFKTLSSLPTEMASLAMGEYLAGNNWSELLKSTDYYGTGFYILFAPACFFIKSPFWLHQFILSMVVLIECIPPVLCYKMMRKHFGIKDKKLSMITALTLSFFDVVTTVMAINEHPLKLTLWIILYIMMELTDNKDKKKRNIYSCMIALLSSYAISIHARAIGLLIMVGMVIMVYFLLYKEWIVNKVYYGVTLALSFLAVNLYVKNITSLLWGRSGSSELRNSNGTLLKIFQQARSVFTKRGITGMLNTIFSQIFTANVYTLGSFLIFLVIFIIVLESSIKNRINRKKTDTLHKRFFVISFFCMVASLCTILANAIINIEAAIIYIDRGEGAKFYIYLRYFFFYLTPMLMCTVCYMNDNWKKIFKYRMHMLVGYCHIVFYFFAFILPTTITKPSLKFDAFYHFAPFTLRKYQEYVTPGHLLAVAVLPVIMYLVYSFLLKKNWKRCMVWVLLLLFAYEYIYNIFVLSFNYMKRNQEYVNGYLTQVYRQEEQGGVQDIYINGAAYMAQIAQYEMPEKTIHQGIPEDIGYGIVLSSMVLEDKEIRKFHLEFVYKLDENEYIYAKEKVYGWLVKIE